MLGKQPMSIHLSDLNNEQFLKSLSKEQLNEIYLQ